jgi:hypothetical protein
LLSVLAVISAAALSVAVMTVQVQRYRASRAIGSAVALYEAPSLNGAIGASPGQAVVDAALGTTTARATGAAAPATALNPYLAANRQIELIEYRKERFRWLLTRSGMAPAL